MLHRKQKFGTVVRSGPVISVIIGSGNVPVCGRYGADVDIICADAGNE